MLGTTASIGDPPRSFPDEDPSRFAAFGQSSNPPLALNNSGNIYINVSILNGGVVTEATMLSRRNSSTPEPLIYNGVAATQTKVFTSKAFFSDFSLNSGNQLVFQASSREGNNAPSMGLWQYDGNSFRSIVDVGQIPPGVSDGSRLLSLNSYNVAPNSHGEFVFGGALINSSGQFVRDFDGIWFVDKSGVSLAIHDGQQAPGLPAGQLFRLINNNPVTMSEAGEYLFSAATGASTAANQSLKFGLWLGNKNGALRKIIMIGDSIDVGEGNLRVVDQLGGLSPYQMNQSLIAFWAHFTDGTQGLFSVSTVPEPCSAALAGTLCVVFFLARRRLFQN
jgi:hypothetical protein